MRTSWVLAQGERDVSVEHVRELGEGADDFQSSGESAEGGAGEGAGESIRLYADAVGISWVAGDE